MTNIALSDIKVAANNGFLPICPFPIGFIYQSTENVSPASIYGGTWTQMSDNKFWLSSTTSEETGGSNTISIDNLPSHTHTGPSHQHGVGTLSVETNGSHHHTLEGIWTQGTLKWATNSGGLHGKTNVTTSTDGNHTHRLSGSTASSGTGNTGATGKGSNYWQPYRTCYCWVRTA